MGRVIANIKFENALDQQVVLFRSILTDKSYRCISGHAVGTGHSVAAGHAVGTGQAVATGHTECLVAFEKKGTVRKIVDELRDAGRVAGTLISFSIMQSRC